MNNDFNYVPPVSASPNDDPILAELASRPKRPRLAFAAGLFVMLVIIGLALGPLIYFVLPGEIARWQMAAAEEKRLDGDIQGAIDSLDRALEEHPNNVQILTKRAQWNKERKEFESALRDYNLLIKLRPDDGSFYIFRSTVLQSLGRHAEAIADLKAVMKLEGPQTTLQRALQLNNLAYARAVGNVDIDQALIDIDEAIRRAGENPSFLDTRGFLYYRQSDFERALNDLNRACENMEETHEAWLTRTEQGRLGASDRREMELEKRERAQSVAVVRYHRMLVHESLSDKEKAEIDRKRVIELGFEPNEKLF